MNDFKCYKPGQIMNRKGKIIKPTKKTLAEVRQIIKHYRAVPKKLDKTIATRKAARKLCCRGGWLYAILRCERVPGELLKREIERVAYEIKHLYDFD